MGPQDLLNRLHGQPFQPFKIELTDASTFEILEPGTVVVGPTSAIVPLETTFEEGYRLVTRRRTIALAHIVQFIDIDKPKQKRRGA